METAVLGDLFEILMLLGFAAAWPFNIAKAWRSRTAVGTSIHFMVVIELAYLCGMVSKVVGDDVNYVLAFYVLDFVLVGMAIALYVRNRRLDAMGGEGATRDNRARGPT